MSEQFARRWREIEPLVERLLDVPDSARDAWLNRHDADPALRAMIVQALAQAGRIDQFESDVAGWLPLAAERACAAPPSIPGYRVRRFVGAGGMASVFEAERALPGATQIVALKLLRVDVHDPDERRRFLREQRFLARLQHVHIARLLDAGFTPAGTPFLALEFVAGTDLIAHCAANALSRDARLGLFGDVCAAVEHAHRNLIVHRDLKPRNVLVGTDGCVKLVDFGIAKLLGIDGDDTRTEARRLTRRYAAPEQIAGAAVTTAIDIYALGVLLAELNGVPPGEARPDLPARASASVFDDAMLRRRLGADLHAIVRTATQVDPSQRYPSVAALHEDIERFRCGKPLRARAPTFAYRAGHFVRRHAFAVIAVAAAATLLVAATWVALLQAQRAGRATQRAQEQAKLAADEAHRTAAVKSFLEGLFDSAAPGVQSNATAADLLARGRERAEREFSAQPALRAEVLVLIGDLERRSGHPQRAQEPLERAAALARQEFGATDRRTLHIAVLRAMVADQLGRVNEGAMQLERALGAFGDGHGDEAASERVRALAWLAGLDERHGASQAAIARGEAALALARRALPQDSPALTEVLLNFGWVLLDSGHAARAETLLRETLARQRETSGTQAVVADTLALLAAAVQQQGKYDESEHLLRAALELDARVYAQRPHPSVGWHLNDLANTLALQERWQEASETYARAIAYDHALAPAAALNEALSRANLARLEFRRGDLVAADKQLRDAIADKQRLLGKDYVDNGRGYDRAWQAEILIARGRLASAQILIDSALAEIRGRHDAPHPETAFALMVAAQMHSARGDCDSALALAREAAGTYRAIDAAGNDKAIRAQIVYGDALLGSDRTAEAKAQFEAALAGAQGTSPTPLRLTELAKDGLTRVERALRGRKAPPPRTDSDHSAGP